jgi:hypothetical protein
MTGTSDTAPAAVTPGQAAYERWHIFQRRRFPGIAPILWGELGAEARAEWENIAQDGAGWATHAFAKDEILANAGPEWDKPEVPETTAREYVRHLEGEREVHRKRMAMLLADTPFEFRPEWAPEYEGIDIGDRVAVVPAEADAEDGAPGYWQARTALAVAMHALQLVKLGTDDKLAAIAREALGEADRIMEGRGGDDSAREALDAQTLHDSPGSDL